MDEDARRAKQNALTDRIIGAAITVHRELGPGLLESAYEECLACEFRHQNIGFEKQLPLPIIYRDIRLDCGYRVDFIVEESVILEIKAVKKLHRIHEAQLMSYLKQSDLRVGLLINFNVRSLKDGIRRRVNQF